MSVRDPITDSEDGPEFMCDLAALMKTLAVCGVVVFALLCLGIAIAAGITVGHFVQKFW